MEMKSNWAITDQSQSQQNQKIFDIYNIYRLVLSLILMVSYFFAPADSILGAYDRNLFVYFTTFYVFLNILVFFRVYLQKNRNLETGHFVAIIIIDILLLVLISYTCGGVTSGMAHLLIVPIAAGSILAPGRISIFLAAVGTIVVIYSETYLYLTFNDTNDYYFQAGLLGLTLFVTSVVIQYLARRISQNDLIAMQQAASIQSLEEMNDQIIQRMRTGIIVVSPDGGVLNTNSSAKKLLLESNIGNILSINLPDELMKRLNAWKKNQENKSLPFRLAKSEPQIQASFSYLNPGSNSNILIFLENYALLASLAQHLKLVSLGRLTASIAHEVRNPLGAISHASQLLNESSNIKTEDHRLIEIIINHSKRVNSIIENILELSRNKGDVSDIIELKPWLEQFIVKFSNSFASDAQIEMDIKPQNILVRANQSQLEQLMTNLCDNGIRYSLEKTGHSHLLIKARINTANECPYMDIIDDGDGISKNDEEQIFEPFFTTESTGTGLGLYICKEICEANQAQLTYRRTEQNKSCFRISFTHPDSNIV